MPSRKVTGKFSSEVKDALKEYRISFSGLAPGVHTFEYHVGQELFDHFGYVDSWGDARIDVRAELTKGTNLMELSLAFQGDVLTPCDATGEEFRLPVQGTDHRVVKQGEGTSLDDDIILLPMGETELNLGQYIYEMIVLNIPQKRYHPDYLSGKLAATKASSSPEPTEQTVDPRWEKLKDIKS